MNVDIFKSIFLNYDYTSTKTPNLKQLKEIVIIYIDDFFNPFRE